MKNLTVVIGTLALGFLSWSHVAEGKVGVSQVKNTSSASRAKFAPAGSGGSGGDGLSSSPESGEVNEQDVQDALKKTQELMENPELRKENAKKDPKAQRADDMVQQITGGNEAMTNEVYALASKVFATIAEQSKGDPKVMQEMLTKFQRDPAGFVGTWTDAERAQLKAIAGQISAPPTSPPK